VPPDPGLLSTGDRATAAAAHVQLPQPVPRRPPRRAGPRGARDGRPRSRRTPVSGSRRPAAA